MAVLSLGDFNPPTLLRHPHTQNLLSSLGLRHSFLRRRTQQLQQYTKPAIVDGGNGVRLTGEISVPPVDANPDKNSKLVILIHGWEGCSQSAYMISAALTLFTAGYSVFRLNLRDHGDSHHLNEQIFNSTLLDEVLNAITDIQQRWPHEQFFLAGYSLGGNFALRVSLNTQGKNFDLEKVVAICPVIDPAHTLLSLQSTLFVYEKYFVRRWRRSLLKKLDHFPHYNYRNELLKLHDLASMHDFFVPRFTGYTDRHQYFSAYAIQADDFSRFPISTHIITSEDDPITKAETLPKANRLTDIDSKLTIHRPAYGSHCAFLQDFTLTSWVDDQLVALFSE